MSRWSICGSALAEPKPWRIGRSALPVLLILLTSLTQFHQLTRDLRFHPDEAHFMTFARGAAVNGDWMLPGALDKPPLSIYFSAFSMVAVAVTADDGGVLQLDPHVGEFAGRLPNALFAILLTALMMRLAWHLYRDDGAVIIAGLLTAASPYILAYGASAFSDMNLLLWSVAALYCVLNRKHGAAGAALGLALWSKQQAALFAVLIVMSLLTRLGRRSNLIRLALPLCFLGGALLIWDGARPETSIFLQAAVNNLPALLLAEPASWLERLGEWPGLSAWLLGPPPVTVILLAGAAIGSVIAGGAGKIGCQTLMFERAALVFIIGYLFVHTAFAFNLYDRYLLLLLPPLILLTAGRLANLLESVSRGRILLVALFALLSASAIWSLNEGSPIGEDRSANAGIDSLAAHLNDKPVATVIYDPWLGWELGYYLGQWNDKRRVHYPTAEALVKDALALDETGDRYLVAPVDQPLENWLTALRETGFGLEVDYKRDRFLVFRLEPPSD